MKVVVAGRKGGHKEVATSVIPTDKVKVGWVLSEGDTPRYRLVNMRSMKNPELTFLTFINLDSKKLKNQKVKKVAGGYITV